MRRHLGVVSATAVVVGEVIGVGIFLTPAGMARALGSPALLLAVWLGMGIATLAGAVCFAELAARFPSAGGLYVFLRQAYGARLAFLFGWMSLLVIDPGLTAVLATGLAEYLGYVVGFQGWTIRLVAIGAILLLAAANMLGVRLAAGLLRGLTILKLGLLVFLVGWGMLGGLGDWSNFVPLVARRPGVPPLMAALPLAMVSAFFSYAGWWDMSKLAGEVRDPERTIPRALTLGVLVVTAAYVLVSGVFLYLVPLDRVTSNEAFVAQAGEVLFGPTGGTALALIVCVA
ncbi:MAG TPA: amino acid permease, partial [Gemmataceae bacterium]|nr:amino acid permease [Gemmataceae bacterium]